ncbi:MAG TPA: AMP-binding protein, partial [Chroococcales cyanobacterium]
GAVHDLNTFAINMIELGDLAHIDPDTAGLLPLPVSHIFGLMVFCIVVSYGGTCVFSEPTPKSFVVCMHKYDPEVLVGVPTIYSGLLGLPNFKVKLDSARIILSGGAPMPLSLADEFKAKFGKRINNGYGSTESKIFALNLDGPFESVGKIVPSTKVEILNDKGEVLPDGSTGEIVVSGKILMQGYLDQPDLTAKVLKDGKYYTGDVGRVEDGYLYVSGRSKEMIIVAGHKVFPSEVEDVIRQHPIVKEVAVVGPPHKQLGQIVKAVIVTKEGEWSDKLSGSADDVKLARQEMIHSLKEFCKENLKRELRPMEYELQPSSKPLPKTLAGKVDKKQLVESK